jgi:hypothetical protein
LACSTAEGEHVAEDTPVLAVKPHCSGVIDVGGTISPSGEPKPAAWEERKVGDVELSYPTLQHLEV